MSSSVTFRGLTAMKQIETRRSIRKYNDQPLDDKMVIQLLESARLAPSGSNTSHGISLLLSQNQVDRN